MADKIRPPTLREFSRTLHERWFVAMASSIGVLAWVTGVIFPKIGAVQIILIAAMAAVILSAYHIWAQERAARIIALELLDKAEATNLQGDLGLRERVRILTAQISHFYNGRFDTSPGPLALAIPPTTPDGWNEATLNAKRYERETIDLYLQRFAPQTTLMLKELERHGVVDAELNAAYLLNSDSLIGIADVAERLSTLAERLPLSGAPAPDVTLTLEGAFPGAFSLHARGHACEIRIGPIVQDSAFIGTMTEGDRTMRVVMPRYVIEFPVVSALRDDDMVVEPSLFVVSPSDNIRSGWPIGGAETAMKEFFSNAETLRRTEIGEPDSNTRSVEEMNEFGRLIRQPIEFRFDVTFWNDTHTDQWKRTEVLVYEPQTRRAFVRPEGSAEFLPQEQRNSVGAVVRAQP